jgi:hypothetical protein
MLAAGMLFPALAIATPGTDALFPSNGATSPVAGAVPVPDAPSPDAVPDPTLGAAGFATRDELVAPPEAHAVGTAVDAGRLDGMRGGDGNVSTTTNRATLRGGVNGNTATNVVGGGNLLSDGSFGNAAGISTVIQNSGSNVLIQNSTIVNVQFVPAP